MDKSQRLNQMYEYARANGMCKNKRSFAEVLGIDSGNLSKAFGNDTKYMTDSLLIRVNNALGNVFSFDWLLTGRGDMLMPVPQTANVNVSTGDNIHHNSGNVATHGAHITNITTIPPTTPAIPTTPPATPATPSATTPATPATSTIPTMPAIPTTPAIPATDDDKDRLIAQLQAQIATLQARVATLQAQIDAQHEHTDLLQALQAQIATLQSQIAELKADKQNLMQLLTNLTQNK